MKEGFIGTTGCLTPLFDDNGMPMYNKFLWYRIPLFKYSYVIPDLVFIDKKEVQYEMDHHFNTDGGSIPPLVRMFPGIHLDPFNFPRSYLFHDCCFQYGGLYISYPGEIDFKFRFLKREEANILLKSMLPFDGATKYDVVTISKCVNVGSRYIWDKNKKPLLQREQRRLCKIKVYNRTGDLIEDN